MRIFWMVVAGFCGSSLQGEEIRWINPLGGEWGEPASWDLGRVPEILDDVIFDLDAAYTVSLCADEPAPLRHLRIEAGEIVFDLCGRDLVSLSEPCPDDNWYIDFHIAGDLTSVEFTNGELFSLGTCFYDRYMTVGQDGDSVVVIVSKTASIDGLEFLGLRGDSVLILEGDTNLLPWAKWDISFGSALYVMGSLEAVCCHTTFDVDGELHVFGAMYGHESRLEGSGLGTVYPGAVVNQWYLLGNRVELRDGGRLETDHAWNARLDMRRAGYESNLTHTAHCCGVTLSGTEIYFGPKTIGSPPLVSLGDSGSFCCFDNTTVHFESTMTMPVGEVGMFGRWDLGSDVGNLAYSDVEFVVDAVTGVPPLLRWAPLGSGLVGSFALGVPVNWCGADLNFDHVLNFFDVAAFLSAYTNRSPWANTNGDFVINFFDVATFLSTYHLGCQ